jgi:hypothetical protein
MSWLTSKLAMIGGIILAVGIAFLKIFSMGKKSARQEVAAETLKTHIEVTQDAKEVREQVLHDGPDTARDRMRSRRRRRE